MEAAPLFQSDAPFGGLQFNQSIERPIEHRITSTFEIKLASEDRGENPEGDGAGIIGSGEDKPQEDHTKNRHCGRDCPTQSPPR
ncbi:hypothetical protein ABIB68_004182 [Bradyrhizobium sp. F1.2.2]